MDWQLTSTPSWIASIQDILHECRDNLMTYNSFAFPLFSVAMCIYHLGPPHLVHFSDAEAFWLNSGVLVIASCAATCSSTFCCGARLLHGSPLLSLPLTGIISASSISLLDNMITAVKVGFSYNGIMLVPETGLEDTGQWPGLAGWIQRGMVHSLLLLPTITPMTDCYGIGGPLSFLSHT